ncbi:MAG: DNA polymerase IV [Woeseia sp.]
MTPAARQVLHVDMDAFYASVEQRDNPELRGKPLVVGGGSNRGVVAAASYEARTFGVRSAMPMREAMRRCPQLLRVAPRMALYKSVSTQIFEVFQQFTPMVEGLSLDEAFLDVTDSLTLFGSAEKIAVEIKRRIHETTELTASVGVAPNKLVAKIASDLDKPDGLVVVTHSNMRDILDPLPVGLIPGIGRQMLTRLHAAHIKTIRDLRSAPTRELEALFGRFAARTRDRASGIDDRPVVSARAEKSISAEETFDKDLQTLTEMQRELLRLCERTGTRLRAKDVLAGTLQIKIRQADFTTFTRQHALHPPTNGTAALYDAALKLLQIWLREHPGAHIRLLGVGGSELARATQGDLFDEQPAANASALDRTVDEIRQKFDSVPLGRARTFNNDQIG